jgi:hypothetical protein
VLQRAAWPPSAKAKPAKVLEGLYDDAELELRA